jgi:hypothetical protein
MMTRRAIDRLLPSAIILAVVGTLFSQTRHFGLLGFDCYPIIVTSRVASLADLIGNFTESLMDGRYTGEFYRPLSNLSFAVDHAVWGLNPAGYQLTSALLLAGCAWAVWLLATRLLGAGARFGSSLALAVFVLSSLHFEVLPVPPRRPELLCCLFVALALALQLSPRALATEKPSPWPALATLLAVASKESGFIVPVLVALAVFLYSDRPGLSGRVRHVTRLLVPHLAAVAIMIVIRVLVLGGMGGHRTFSVGDIFSSVGLALQVVANGLLLPQPAMSGALVGRWLLTALLFALAVTLVWSALRTRRPDEPQPMPFAPKTVIVAVAWIGLLGLTYAAAGLIGPWYLLLPLAGWALLTGALAERLLSLAGGDARPLGWLATATLTLLVGLLVWQSSYSPVFRHYDEWERATTAADTFLDRAQSLIEDAAPGSVVEAPPMPVWAAPKNDGPTVRGAAIFADYSIQAWAELVFPGRKVRVIYAGPDVPPPAADEIVLLITRRLDGV